MVDITNHLKRHFAIFIACCKKAEILRPEMGGVVFGSVKADVELSRQVGILPAADEDLIHLSTEFPRVKEFARQDAA